MRDIKGGNPKEYLVIGWFTPNYRELAEAFATNLNEYQIPFHLYAKPNLGSGWNTTRKPEIVLEAMGQYPGRIIVLMDVDCQVKENIFPVTQIDGDVGIAVFARDVRNNKKVRHWLAMECSSRVAVFRPTNGAKLFSERWANCIAKSSFPHDEHSMAWAFLKSPDISFSYIDQRYSGREIGTLASAIILHDSAHEKQKTKNGTTKELLRRVERKFFRTGRTKHLKLQSEMSVMQALGDK